MRKRHLIMFICTIIFCAFGSGYIYAASIHGTFKGFQIAKLYIDGSEVRSNVPAIVIDGTTMVPLRVISEKFGKAVDWNSQTYTVQIGQKANIQPGTNFTDGAATGTGSFEFSGLNEFYTSYGALTITGEVKNVSGKNFTGPLEVNVTLYDSTKKVVGSARGNIGSGLLKDQTKPFEVLVFNPPTNIDSYYVTVNATY